MEVCINVVVYLVFDVFKGHGIIRITKFCCI